MASASSVPNSVRSNLSTGFACSGTISQPSDSRFRNCRDVLVRRRNGLNSAVVRCFELCCGELQEGTDVLHVGLSAMMSSPGFASTLMRSRTARKGVKRRGTTLPSLRARARCDIMHLRRYCSNSMSAVLNWMPALPNAVETAAFISFIFKHSPREAVKRSRRTVRCLYNSCQFPYPLICLP